MRFPETTGSEISRIEASISEASEAPIRQGVPRGVATDFGILARNEFDALALAHQPRIDVESFLPPGVIEMAARAYHMGEVLERISERMTIPALDVIGETHVVIREHAEHRLLIVERFTKRWKQSQLWFPLSLLSEEDHYLLAGMEEAEIKATLDEALERVVIDGVYTQLLTSALEEAPHITRLQRKDLQRGLALAEEGNFEDALPPFLVGMEGAFWRAGEAMGVVDDQRRLLQHHKQKEAKSVEPVFKALAASEDYSTFLLYRVFGGRGNHARHGRDSFPRREHVLCLVVALAGWMDRLMEVPAREVLGQMLRDAL